MILYDQHLIYLCIQNNYLSWNDIVLQDKKLRSLIWLQFLHSTLHKQEIKKLESEYRKSSNVSSCFIDCAEKLYNKGFSGQDLIYYIQYNQQAYSKGTSRDDVVGKELVDNCDLLFHLSQIKKEFRCEKTFILQILFCLIFRSFDPFHNILLM